jgi:hypothetical protein
LGLTRNYQNHLIILIYLTNLFGLFGLAGLGCCMLLDLFEVEHTFVDKHLVEDMIGDIAGIA